MLPDSILNKGLVCSGNSENPKLPRRFGVDFRRVCEGIAKGLRRVVLSGGLGFEGVKGLISIKFLREVFSIVRRQCAAPAVKLSETLHPFESQWWTGFCNFKTLQ